MREGGRVREREIQRYRETDRQTDRLRLRERERERVKETEPKMERGSLLISLALISLTPP